MARIMEAEGGIEFRNDDHAERFAEELRRRDGGGIVAELAAGRTEALAEDVSDPERRRWIARAVVSAARAHTAFGLTLREIDTGVTERVRKGDRTVDREW